MSRNIIGMYASHDVAEAVVRDLLHAGVARDRMAVAVDEPARRYREVATLTDRRRERNGGKGAVVGLLLGLIVGAVVAWIVAVVPDPGWILGPDLTASLVLSAAIGALAGVILGWFAGAMSRRGVPVPSKHPEHELLQRRGVVVAADVPSRQARRITRLMERHGPVDLDRRARSWHRREGWRPLLPPVTSGSAIAAPAQLDDRDAAWRREDVQREPEHAIETHRGPAYDPAAHDRPLGSQRPHHRTGSLRAYYEEESDDEARRGDEWSASMASTLEPRFRRHFDRNYRHRDESWDVHHEAYALGARLAYDSRSKPFSGFHELENLARMRWESGEHADVPYRRVRESMAYGFEEGRLTFA